MPSDVTKGATEGLERRISSMDENTFHENEKNHKRINDTHKLCIRIRLGFPMSYMIKKWDRNFNWSGNLPR